MTPEVEDVALSCVNVVAHVSTLSKPALAMGAVLLRATKATSVAIQAPEETVRVYVPAALTTALEVLAPDTIIPPLLATQL